METEQRRAERIRWETSVKRGILPSIVKSMTDEGLDVKTISRILMPVFGLTASVAQIRKIVTIQTNN